MQNLRFVGACLLGALVVLVDTPSYITSVVVDGVGVFAMLALMFPGRA